MNPSADKTIQLNKLVPYGLNRAKSTRLDPGGKGINVARVLKSFGVEVTVTGMIAGRQGDALIEQLGACGIDSDFVKVEGENKDKPKDNR